MPGKSLAFEVFKIFFENLYIYAICFDHIYSPLLHIHLLLPAPQLPLRPPSLTPF